MEIRANGSTVHWKICTTGMDEKSKEALVKMLTEDEAISEPTFAGNQKQWLHFEHPISMPLSPLLEASKGLKVHGAHMWFTTTTRQRRMPDPKNVRHKSQLIDRFTIDCGPLDSLVDALCQARHVAKR